MAKAKKSTNFEERYLDSLEDKIDGVDGKLDKLTTEQRKGFKNMDKRVGDIEEVVFPKHKETIQELPSVWRDPQVIKLFTIIATAILILLLIYAGLKGVSLPRGIFG